MQYSSAIYLLHYLEILPKLLQTIILKVVTLPAEFLPQLHYFALELFRQLHSTLKYKTFINNNNDTPARIFLLENGKLPINSGG